MAERAHLLGVRDPDPPMVLCPLAHQLAGPFPSCEPRSGPTRRPPPRVHRRLPRPPPTPARRTAHPRPCPVGPSGDQTHILLPLVRALPRRSRRGGVAPPSGTTAAGRPSG